MIDELFLGTLEANLRIARERGEEELQKRLEKIHTIIQDQLKAAMPTGLQFVQDLLSLSDQKERLALLEQRNAEIDDDLLSTLMASIQRLESTNQQEGAQEMRELYKKALKLKMKSSMGTA